MNRVPHLVRAEKIQRVQPEPIKEDFNLDALFLEPEDLEETERPVANLPAPNLPAPNPPAPNLESIFLERLEQFQNRPIHIVVGPSSVIPHPSEGPSPAIALPTVTSSGMSYSLWTMPDIFEEQRNILPIYPDRQF